MDAVRFDRMCGWLTRWFNVLPLAVAIRQLRQGGLPARPLCITFDDGYADNHTVALPILRRHGLSATFFVATGFLDGGIMWNDVVIESVRRTQLETLDTGQALGLPIGRLALASAGQRRAAVDALIRGIKYLPHAERNAAVHTLARHARVDLRHDLMMTSRQVLELRGAGMAIGGHTVSHPILARLGATHALAEIADGKRALEALLHEPIELFAYPNGKPQEDFSDEHADMVRTSGFAAAVTTGWGAANTRTDLYRLPRFTPWDRTRWRFGLRMLGNLRRRSDLPQLPASSFRTP